MANVNSFNCATFTPNVGYGSCTINPGLLLGWIAVPRGTTYTLTGLTTLVTTLQTAANQNPAATRAYPLGSFIAVTDSSTDTVMETTDYGVELIARDGTYIWAGRTVNGNFCYYKSLRGFHGKQDAFDLIAVFKNGLMLTYVPNTTTGAAEYRGIRPSLIDVPLHKIASGTAAEQYMIKVQIFDSAQITDNSLLLQTSTSVLTTVTGIAAVSIQNSATWNASPAGSIDVLPVIGCGGDSLVTIYGTTLNNAALWVATNALTGAGITITGVTIVGGKYRIQLDVADPDYPASAAYANITMTTAALLYAAGVIGYESDILHIARP